MFQILEGLGTVSHLFVIQPVPVLWWNSIKSPKFSKVYCELNILSCHSANGFVWNSVTLVEIVSFQMWENAVGRHMHVHAITAGEWDVLHSCKTKKNEMKKAPTSFKSVCVFFLNLLRITCFLSLSCNTTPAQLTWAHLSWAALPRHQKSCCHSNPHFFLLETVIIHWLCFMTLLQCSPNV